MNPLGKMIECRIPGLERIYHSGTEVFLQFDSDKMKDEAIERREISKILPFIFESDSNLPIERTVGYSFYHCALDDRTKEPFFNSLGVESADAHTVKVIKLNPDIITPAEDEEIKSLQANAIAAKIHKASARNLYKQIKERRKLTCSNDRKESCTKVKRELHKARLQKDIDWSNTVADNLVESVGEINQHLEKQHPLLATKENDLLANLDKALVI